MSRTINQVSHDLRPMLETIREISENMNVLLSKLYQELALKDIKLKDHFETCLSAAETLNECSEFAMIYIDEVDIEAEKEGIEKHY